MVELEQRGTNGEIAERLPAGTLRSLAETVQLTIR